MSTSQKSWDPDEWNNLAPSKGCLSRIRTDLNNLRKDPLPGIYCVQDDTLVNKCHALIVGPFDTPYEGGFFYFTISCPENYPCDPPRAKLMTTGGGRVRFNPNLYANGKVCLSILGTWSGPGWDSIQSLGSVLLSIQSLMNENPYHNEPGFEAPNQFASRNYNDCIRHETLRIAVCEMANPESATHKSLPEPFQEIILALYPSFAESYELTCNDYIAKDGTPMVDPFGEARGTFQYGAILKKLQEINTAVGCVGGGDDDGDALEDEATAGAGRGEEGEAGTFLSEGATEN